MGGATPMLGADDLAARQRDRGAAGGLGDCDLLGNWVEKGVLVTGTGGAGAGKKGVIRSYLPGSTTLAVKWDGMSAPVNTKLVDVVPRTGAEVAQGTWVRVLGGDFAGQKAVVDVVEEEDGTFLLQLGEEMESIPWNICIAVEAPQ